MRFAFFMLASTCAVACAPTIVAPAKDPELCDDPSKGPKNDQVHVHLTTDERDATIERRSIHDATDWKTVCTAPCDLHLFVDDEYRIGGKGIVPSEPFRLDGETDSSDVEVDAARRSTRTMGTILLGVSAGSAALSTFVWSIYMSTHPPDPLGDRATRALAISFAVDFLLLVPGIALSAASTSATISPVGSPTSSKLAIVPGGFVF
jgi:hypothetical protein